MGSSLSIAITPHFELGVRNISALAANFHALEFAAISEIKNAVQKWGEETQRLTQQFCPVDTGFMREHVTLVFSPNGYAFEVGWSADDFLSAGLAFYPFFVEFGTVKMDAQPSLFPAYQITSEELGRDIGDILRNEFGGGPGSGPPLLRAA